MSAGGYAEAYDPRRGGRIPMASFEGQLRYGAATSLPLDLLFGVLLSKSLAALALHVAKDWVLDAGGMRASSLSAWTMAVAGVALCAWERSWESGGMKGKRRTEPSSPLYPFIFAFETLFALLSIAQLSVFRFILLTSFASLWARGLPILKTGGRRAVGSSNALFMTGAMVIAAYVVDSFLTAGVARKGYVFLLLHLLAAGQRSEIYSSFTGDERARGKMHANAALIAAGISGVLAFVHSLFSPSCTAAAATPASTAFTPPATSLSVNLLSAAILALTYLVFDPLLTRALTSHFPPTKVTRAGWPLAALGGAFVGYVGFGRGMGIAEGALAVIAWNAISHLSLTDPRSSSHSASSFSTSSAATGSTTAPAPLLTRLSTFYRHLRATIKTILASPESRRIYFFLCLNLAYMFVQMAYGIWTNSLGLISDSIHMFFDCAALAMGLFASVMATWPSNEIYTYGYSRVETLSGFANGIFLCLISIFIVFEAVERLLDPPEMNTGQLLTVSAVGLAVNLVGMVATGHGHHGHSHGGGGGHSHGHSHAPVRSKSTPFLTEKEEEDEDHGHSHNGHSHASFSHSHSHAATPPRPSPSSHSHSHASSPSPSHTASPSHIPHDHSHSTSHGSHSHGGHSACGDAHDHHEGEDDDHVAAHSGGSHNMKGVFLHVMADTLGSVGVIISTLLINRYGWTGFDPLASIFIAVLIFASVAPLVVDSGRLLVLDMGEEKEAEVRKALTALHRVEGVSSFTRPRFWQKDPSSMVGSICIQLSPAPGYSHTPHVAPKHCANIEKTVVRVRRALRANIGGLEDVVIQVEPTGGLLPEGQADEA